MLSLNLSNLPKVFPKKDFAKLTALSQHQFDLAQQIHLEIHTSHEQFATWMVGIKRLIDMARLLG
jgi:hypothetical protein